MKTLLKNITVIMVLLVPQNMQGFFKFMHRASRIASMRMPLIKPAFALRPPAAIFKPKNFSQRSINTSGRSITSNLLAHCYRPLNSRISNVRPWAWLLGAGVGLLGIKSAQGEKADTPKFEPKYEMQRKKYYDQLLKNPWAHVVKKYMQIFAMKEKELKDEFFELTRLTSEEWEQFKITHFDTFRRVQVEIEEKQLEKKMIIKEIPAPLKEVIEQQLKKLGMQNCFVFMNKKERGFMKIRFDALEIMENSDGHRCNEEFISLLYHEFMHLMHDDVYESDCYRTYFKYFVDKKRISKDKADLFQYKVDRFHEVRADFLAACASLDNAKHLSQLFKRFSLINNHFGCRHVASSMRADYFNKLYQEMSSASSTKKSGGLVTTPEYIFFDQLYFF